MVIWIPNTGGKVGKVMPRFVNFYFFVIQVIDILNDSYPNFTITVFIFFLLKLLHGDSVFTIGSPKNKTKNTI